MQHFAYRNRGRPDPALQIDFPVAGTRIELPRREGHLTDLPLAASGRQPLRWLVNGQPLESSSRRRMTFWTRMA
ncbi:MAG: hypothetical protein H6971_05555 [Gammaproteobacteria bacterium]|nr:hypothetical protein [Gammaproteobacteria bacterium]